VAEVFPDGQLLQLHGFTADKRKTPAGRQADMILSSGTRFPSFSLIQIRACLQEHLAGNIFLFPYDVEELGGTLNVIGDLMRSLGHPGFVHVEMGKPLRDLLRTDQTARKIVIRCTKLK
jgi:hypothetical protein